MTLKDEVRQLEIDRIKETLKQTAGRVASASRLLGVPIASMWKKLAKYGINPKDFDPERGQL